MATMVSSVVVQEMVHKILSGLIHKYEGKEKSNAEENLERLEMAHIKLEAAIQISNKWQITDASLLRWRKKLKCAAWECDDALHKRKERILEEQQMEQEVSNSSFSKRIAHAAKSAILSAFNRNNNESSRSVVRRFEWLADGASEFLRFIELGGTPGHHMPFDPFVRHLFSGKKLQHIINMGNGCLLFLLWVPYITVENGVEAGLVFIRKDNNTPEGNFFLSVMLQLSESTDIVGITTKCLQLLAPHFKSTVEIIRKELTLLPTQDFLWVPSLDSGQKEHWDNLHNIGSQWFRPNPLCCKQHDQHELCRISNLDMVGLQDVSLEPVIEVNLQCQVSLSEYNKHRTSLSEDKISLQGSPYLKAGLVFAPHGSSEDMLPMDKSSAIALIDGEEQHCLHIDISLEQLEDIMWPKAIDYFNQNAGATVYQMIWKSKHGIAYIQVEKASMKMQRTQRTYGEARKKVLLRPPDQKLGSQAHVISHFLDLWVAHAPIRLRSSILDWIQKEKESQLVAPQLHLKF